MKHLTTLLLAFIMVFGFAANSEARDHRRGHRPDHGRHFGPGYSHRDKRDHYHRHHSKPHYHKRHGNYYRSPGYYGRHYYGKRIFLPGIGFIYIR